MHASAANVAFELFGIFKGLAHEGVGVLKLRLELRHEFVAVGEI